jgi:hypothetical protein
VAAAFVFGRIDSRGRELTMLVLPMVATAPVMALLLPASGLTGGDAAIGLAFIGASMALLGLLNGPLDIALFTLRQRRTDPAWMGRAFAVSMAFNSLGFPVGSLLAGWLAASSIEIAIAFGVVASLSATAIAGLTIPRSEPAVRS